LVRRGEFNLKNPLRQFRTVGSVRGGEGNLSVYSERNVSDRLRRIQLAQLSSPHGTVWQVTEPNPDAAKCLKSLQIKPPPPVLHLA